MRFNKKSPLKSDKKAPPKAPKKGVVGYNKKTALLEEAITQMNEGKYGRSSAALKELLALDPLNTEARRLFATLHLRLGSLISARTAFESLAREALDRQDFWLAESLLREYLTAGPRCVPFLDMLGQVYEQKGDSMAAVAEYGKAIEVLVEDPDADHPDRASDLFARIRALAADSPEAIRLALLFDSATGQLLRPSSVSDSIPSSETPQPANESIAAAADSPPTQTEQPQSYTEPAAEHEPIATSEAPAAPEAPPIPLLEQYQNLSQTALDTAPADDTAEQAHNIHDNTEGERQLRAVQETDDSLPSVLPINDARDETLDAPFKLTDEAATPPASATASDLDPAPAIASDLHPTPAPTHDTTECSVGKNSELASEVIVELIAVPDLSLHEVTQPIAEPPSSPVSMPWDQVQDTTLSIPLPSLEPESEQMPDTETTGQTEEQSVTGTTGMADDQPSLPVQPESLLSSMSWEEILAEVGKGAEQGSPILDHPALESKDPVLTPISEPVAEAQALPVPMPWEQVEEESVPILRHEPEPEFGIVPEHPLPPIIDEPQTLRLEDLKSDANDMTLAIQEPTGAPPVEEEQIHADSSVATRYEPVQEQSVEPPAEPPFNQAYIPPPVEEVSPAPPIPSEPPSIEPAPVHPITEETPLPDTAELVDETAIVADPPPVAEVAEPRVVHTETDPASCEPGRTERGATNAITEISADASAPLPIAHQDFQSTTSEPFTAAAPEPGPALEESISTAQTIEQEPQPAAHEPAASDEIKILWDGRSPQSIPDQAKTGLLSRWLRKPKQDEPAPALESPESAISEPSHDSMSATPSVASELNESLTPDATIHAIATSDLSPDQSTRFLSPVSDEKPRRTKARKPSVASLSTRIATGAGRFISGCFSTTRSIIISLIVLVSTIVISALAAIGLAALTWIFVEEQPSPAFHNLNVTPQRTLQEASTNGYLALLGFDRGPKQDAAQAGFSRKFENSDLAMKTTCLMNPGERRGTGRTEPEGMLAGWYHDPDPAARFRAQTASLRSWVNEADRTMGRYKQWLTMPFEDWGYGELMSPNCPVILYAHRLYVADGFAQDLEAGIERLAVDLAMWRNVMAQAKSLPIKMLAASAVDDDTAVASGLLARPDLDERLVARLAKAVRPLNQGEQSLRWPMQSELKAAEKTQDTLLKSISGEAPIYVSVVSMMPLPTQKRLNSYAAYYEVSGKAATETGFAGLPKRAGFVRYPPESWLDYGLNPIENILGVPPLPEWQTYGGRILELDAKLRLASLQAWIKRSPQEQDIPTRMAKAGQALYDPFTGFPMLVNRRKGLIYSVGQDGKDHDGQPAFDIAAVIPPQPGGFPSDGKRSKTRP